MHPSPINSYTASQADVAVFKAVSSAPDAAKYPHAARWYKHIASFESEFATLSGDASKPYTVYGPDASEVTLNPAKAPAAAEEDDEDVDLFGSDDEEEDAEAARVREERLAEYRKKKEGKTKPAAKSVVTMDVKPWGMLISPCFGRGPLYSHVPLSAGGRIPYTLFVDANRCCLSTDDETDMAALEESVRSIEKDGLTWGASKLVPVGYGVKKLQINLVVEDDKISLEELEEQIREFEDYVQSCDVVAMQKL